MEETIASVVSGEGASAWLAHIADMLGAAASGMLALRPGAPIEQVCMRSSVFYEIVWMQDQQSNSASQAEKLP